MQSAGIKKKTELWILIPHCWTWGCWASAGRLIEWIMNRLLTSLVLKVSLVLSEVPACRGWPWQRSGASSIVWDKKAALLGLSSSTPCRLPCRNTYKYIVQRWRGVWPLSSMVSPFTLTCTNCPSGPVTQRSWHLLLYGCSLSYWDCVIQAKEDRGVPPPPLSEMPGSCQSPANHTVMHMSYRQRLGDGLLSLHYNYKVFFLCVLVEVKKIYNNITSSGNRWLFDFPLSQAFPCDIGTTVAKTTLAAWLLTWSMRYERA